METIKRCAFYSVNQGANICCVPSAAGVFIEAY